MIPKHKVFISYHHVNDEAYKTKFELLFGTIADAIVSRSVQIGDIDPTSNTETIRRTIRDKYLRDSSVTVVLVGSQTWQRKHVDWEIYSSLRDTEYNARSGLLGIILPTYPRTSPTSYSPYTIPPRLHDNLECRFAGIHNWSENATHVQEWIHAAFQRRTQPPPPDLSRPMFANNRTGDRWFA